MKKKKEKRIKNKRKMKNKGNRDVKGDKEKNKIQKSGEKER